MSGGGGKRATRGEKSQASEAAKACLNALMGGDGMGLHEAKYLFPERVQNVSLSGQSVVAPPLAQVGEKRSLEPDYKNFDYDIELKKLEIREKDLALYKKEQQAKLDFDSKQAEIETKNKEAEAEVYTKKKRADWMYKGVV